MHPKEVAADQVLVAEKTDREVQAKLKADGEPYVERRAVLVTRGEEEITEL